MLILHAPAKRRETADGPGHQVRQEVLLLGVGLIGGRIASRLLRRGWQSEPLPLSWDDDGLRRRQLDDLRRRLAERAESGGPTRRRHWIWTAGRAGFRSTEDEIADEERSFAEVLSAAETMQDQDGIDATFHMASSIGGLFEGQRHVRRHSRPRPLRPYGDLKCRQEARLERADSLHRRVYRLSSVYGPAPGNERRGLVATLLYDAMAGRTTTLVGRPGTLRDYLWSEDLARFVEASLELGHGESYLPETYSPEIYSPEISSPEIFHLASGKPSSIQEILEIVGRIVGRRPSIRFARAQTNSTDITLSPASLPPGWFPTDLETSMRFLHRTLGGRTRRVADTGPHRGS